VSGLIRAFGVTDIGCVRTSNQDRILVDDAAGLYIVADGMGGHGHGEVAAELAVTTSQFYVQASRDRFDVSWPFGYDVELSLDENRLRTAIQLANRQVWKSAEESPERAGMGTTIVAALVNGNHAALGNVGDSRIYLLRGGALTQLSSDDSWVANMVRNGALTAKQAREHSMRNVLTQAIGSHSAVEVHTSDHQFESGDLLLMTTDGVHGVVDEAVIRSILFATPDIERAGQQLVQAAKENGAPDNASCILLRYESESAKS
jgi:serine/threonine protein phosphatase PrpC